MRRSGVSLIKHARINIEPVEILSQVYQWLMVQIQFVLPQHGLSRLVFHATRIRWRPWTRLLIRMFVRYFRIDLGDAAQPDADKYACFNSFFTRALAEQARPLCPGAGGIAAPVDGTISELGKIEDQRLLQAKGRYYSLEQLLAGSGEYTDLFDDGRFATIYLAPANYHRVHMPVSAHLTRMVYVPGRLFSVNPGTTGRIDGLFARNERALFWFTTDFGAMVLCMVGALCVGNIETIIHGQIAPNRNRSLTVLEYNDATQRPAFRKGQEFARFNMGSTVILLFQGARCNWHPGLVPGHRILMGEKIGQLR